MSALEKDGWERTTRKNNTVRYEKNEKDVVIHYCTHGLPSHNKSGLFMDQEYITVFSFR